ncbi:IS1595 family transposase [Rubellimicrobium sp. CFH 75288]|uniref:IS1595 family transposase n=1 Tax=Rubellimicrobium sp. CFH 75288 TaxID=2697034 RepID=UPI001411D11E|nr:IS1595 family transposase [Rubellimicrobium sp. CFH 75288]NAZ36160.1 IS1595 family transposase [Rubellimicrobium sp. CFH 75288]
MSVLSRPEFHDEEAALAYVEGLLWPQGPVCPKCGTVDEATKLKGKSTRPGTYKCRACRKPFTVKVGTIFEASHVPMTLWVQAIYLMCSSKKGISSNQLHRTLGVTLKTAWFMSHRIREAMRSGDLAPFGGNGGAVEVDETFIGREPGREVKRAYHHKMKVLSLVDRETKQARSVVVDDLKPATLVPILRENIAREAHLMTDEARHYLRVGREFAAHGIVEHGVGEYARGTDHTNTVEGYFSIFKRGMKGTYQHCAKKHLHRYLAEFDFRYNNRVANGVVDGERTARALLGVIGKRLTYAQ